MALRWPKMCARAVALWCALVVAASARAAAYTVDCNHEYTDCDTELSAYTASLYVQYGAKIC